MNEAQWSSNLVIAWLLWALGGAIILLDLFLSSTDDIGHVGIAVVIAGALFYNRELATSIQSRERTAYDLGRESIRSVR